MSNLPTLKATPGNIKANVRPVIKTTPLRSLAGTKPSNGFKTKRHPAEKPVPKY